MNLRPLLLFAICLLWAAPAFAGVVPELDPSQMGTGIALAGAIVLFLSDRRVRGRKKRDSDSDPPA